MIFEATTEEIERLDDSALREFVGRLCRAEANACGLGAAAVRYGGNQNAPDGGVDVEVNMQDNNSKNPWTIRGMRREENSDYPYRAVREVLVNAMIHRDYQIIGTEIHVDMFDDRLEITSPGGMLSGSRIQDMDLRRVPSMRRNEIISDIFGRLHYMDRRGSGIGRILNSYAEFAESPAVLFYRYLFFGDSAKQKHISACPDNHGPF